VRLVPVKASTERTERPLEKALAYTTLCPRRALGGRGKVRALPGAGKSSFRIA
jgi:hypothetical protein